MITLGLVFLAGAAFGCVGTALLFKDLETRSALESELDLRDQELAAAKKEIEELKGNTAAVYIDGERVYSSHCTPAPAPLLEWSDDLEEAKTQEDIDYGNF